jgi:hypothetical protein
MTDTVLTFAEVLETARCAGFELTDARGLPVRIELESAIEDGNLTAEAVRVELQPSPGDRSTGVVANLMVRGRIFYLHGQYSRVGELGHLLGGAAASPRSSPLGDEPGE